MQVPDTVKYSVSPVEVHPVGRALPALNHASGYAAHVQSGMTDRQLKVTYKLCPVGWSHHNAAAQGRRTCPIIWAPIELAHSLKPWSGACRTRSRLGTPRGCCIGATLSPASLAATRAQRTMQRLTERTSSSPTTRAGEHPSHGKNPHLHRPASKLVPHLHHVSHGLASVG